MWLRRGRGWRSSAMSKYIFCGPSGEVEPDPVRQEPETGRSEIRTALPVQHGVELFPQGMEVKHVGCGIGDLGVGKFLGAPIGQLLLLGNVDAEEVADQILQAVLVRI